MGAGWVGGGPGRAGWGAFGEGFRVQGLHLRAVWGMSRAWQRLGHHTAVQE